MTSTDPIVAAMAELEWLKQNPQFEERPATLEEFLGSNYLNIRRKVRRRILRELRKIMGEEVNGQRPTAYALAMITGGIGIGKTTIASIVLPYLAHWVLCLKDPQDFYDLLPGSRIAFMQMSTSEQQAREVLFGDIKARIEHSPWFKGKYPHDPNFKNQIRFPKDIWIIPGDSTETTFEGYNILGGILDEADSHKVTQHKDYAEQGYSTIESRISSRFQDRGFLLVIGQMKSAHGFAARKYKEMLGDPKAHVVKLAIWESMGDEFYAEADGTVRKFYYDAKNKRIVPKGVVDLAGGPGERFIAIPELYRPQFEKFPEKALRDLAGIPPAVNDPFISLVNKIEEARDRWIESHDGLESPVDRDGRIAKWFHAKDTLPRVAHLDIAYADGGDAAGIVMGHVREMVEREDELKPYIVIDLLYRVKAPAGGEIFLSELRQFLYALRSTYGFKLKKVTTDGFESTDTQQQLRKKRFDVEQVSVDRQVLPYHDLREAIYEDRIEFPPYVVTMDLETGTSDVEILVKELSELVDTGKKIDHPIHGSKDVADGVAGVTFTLMGDRRYRRNVRSFEQARQEKQQRLAAAGMGHSNHPAIRGDFDGAAAPLPPTTVWRQ